MKPICLVQFAQNVRNKGAFQIPIGFLAQHKDREQLYRLACEIIHEKFLAAIGHTDNGE